MIPTLLLPAGLAALAALLLPLLLHLARREARKPVDFAALRWLSARVRPRRSLRFEERLLLALRLLLIALLALLLARPVLPRGDDGVAWIVAAPGVGAQALRAPAPALEGDEDGGIRMERRWLATGFPALQDAAAPEGPQPTMSLLRELDMHMPAGSPLVVLVPPVLEGVDAERPRLSRPVEWRVVASASDDGADSQQATSPAADAHAVPPLRLLIQDAGSDDGARYLRAASSAWESQDLGPAAGREVRAWLAPGELPATGLAWIEAGGTALLAHDGLLPALQDAATLWSDDEGRPLLRGAVVGRGRVLQWTRPLQPEAMPALLESDFPHRLRAALQPAPPPSRVLAAEHAPVIGGAGPRPQSLRDLSPWLALAIALLFLVERWIAAGPRWERGA